MIIMKDVCRLNDDEAKQVLLWTAQTLLHAALQQTAAPKRRRG
jgi:hypothetical protein